jgi:hypothetical protein
MGDGADDRTKNNARVVSNGCKYFTEAKMSIKRLFNHYLFAMNFDTICADKNQRGANAAIE